MRLASDTTSPEQPAHTDPSSMTIREVMATCGRDAAFLSELANLYTLVDADAAATGAVCLGGGTCCKFDLCDHRLYVSGGELALLSKRKSPAQQHRSAGGGETAIPQPLRCPYQVGPRCTARSVRPLGCRVYFCRKEMQDWCSRTYERYHRRIRRLHDSHHLPYIYVELTASLARLSTGGSK